MDNNSGCSVTLKELVNEFHLEEVSGCDRLEEILVTTSDINRPGLQLAGYLGFFGSDRIQIMGKGETEYLAQLTPEVRRERLDNFFKCGFPCMIVARGLEVFPEMVEVSDKSGIQVLRTNEITSRFLSRIISHLNVELAPRTTKHGVFVEVHGEGILILRKRGGEERNRP